MSRFSLLLLEEDEFYITECVVECKGPLDGGPSANGVLPGQLRICTKSVFFESDDVKVPIVRIPYLYVEELEGFNGDWLRLTATRWSTMKPNARDVPYAFYRGKAHEWKMKLMYAPLGKVLPHAQHMLLLSRLPVQERKRMQQDFLSRMEEEQRFNVGFLLAPGFERLILEMPVMLVGALTKEPGKFVLSDQRLYFQPLHNISGGEPVMSVGLGDIAAVSRRRSGLKELGVEMFFGEKRKKRLGKGCRSSSVFFVFRSKSDRDEAIARLLDQEVMREKSKSDVSTAGSLLEADDVLLYRVTAAWQRGLLSNFDYILYCNLAAGRSFNDLTQYPVFPWVIKEFSKSEIDLNDVSIFRDLGKPVGALNPGRLQVFKERYREMESMKDHAGEAPFMYGTHYSCPGYTLYWLVRSMPAHMLRLQNGKFDAPDRSFTSISEAWDSVYSNPADLKELIPEFYMPEKCEFLRNSSSLALGCRQDGRPVGDVVLPPWAQNDAGQFVRLQREALESAFVSANLHHWIDLIFGVKQRGKLAFLADNVFRNITYEGAIKIEDIEDEVERAGIEVAISEFGQCPKQIFHEHHPRRMVCHSEEKAQDNDGSDFYVSGVLSRIISIISEHDASSIDETVSEEHAAKLNMLDLLPSSIDDPVGAEEDKDQADADDQADEKETRIREVPRETSRGNRWDLDQLRNTVLEKSKNIRNLGNVYGDSFSPTKMMSKLSSHFSSSIKSTKSEESGNSSKLLLQLHIGNINSISLSTSGQESRDMMAAVASQDGYVAILDHKYRRIARKVQLTKSSASSVSWMKEDTLCGGADGMVYKYKPSTGQVSNFRAHDDSISCMCNLNDSFLYTAAWDSTVKEWDMGENRMPWNSSFSSPSNMIFHPSGAAWSMAGVAPKTILIGSEEGALSLVDFRANVVSLSAKLCTDYIGGVAVCSNGNMFAAAAADGVLRIYDARKFNEIVLQKDYDSPLRCCSAIGDIVLCGAEDGNLHSCSLQPGVSEAPRPVFDGASGGAINCISTYSVFSTQNSGNHCSIGLGFEDGSVCLTAF